MFWEEKHLFFNLQLAACVLASWNYDMTINYICSKTKLDILHLYCW